MMFGRLNNMDIADDWRIQELDKRTKSRRLWAFALAVSVLALLVAWPKASRADSITFDGRTEEAQCHYETKNAPDMGLAITEEICISESYLCRIQGGDVECSVKR